MILGTLEATPYFLPATDLYHEDHPLHHLVLDEIEMMDEAYAEYARQVSDDVYGSWGLVSDAEGHPRCPKCGAYSGDDWSQCVGWCPIEMSPYFDVRARAVKYPPLDQLRHQEPSEIIVPF